jgi:hypothetical protein
LESGHFTARREGGGFTARPEETSKEEMVEGEEECRRKRRRQRKREAEIEAEAAERKERGGLERGSVKAEDGNSGAVEEKEEERGGDGGGGSGVVARRPSLFLISFPHCHRKDECSDEEGGCTGGQ